MKKYLVMALVSSFIGIMFNPEMLAASDLVAVRDLDRSGAAANVPVVIAGTEVAEPEASEEAVLAADAAQATSVADAATQAVPVSQAAPMADATANSATQAASSTARAAAPNTSANSIQITGKNLQIQKVDSTTYDAGDHVDFVGKLLYGHNSTAVFGGLVNVKIGDTFTVTLDGKTTTYRVSAKTVYKKADLLLNCNETTCTNRMADIKNNAMGHDIALMTCHGEMLGGGDATERLVILADKI